MPKPTKVDTRTTAAAARSEMAPSSIVEGSLDRVLRIVASKMHLESPEQVIKRLKVNDPEVITRFRQELAREAAIYLGTLDRNVKAAYLVEYEATPEDLVFRGEELAPVNLILWVARKTAALQSAAAALDRALVESYEEQVGSGHPQYLLDVQLVDDHDVANRKGYGAMLTSIHMPPLEIWRAR